LAVKKYLAKHNVTASEHRPYSPDLSAFKCLLVPILECVLKVQELEKAEKVTAKATTALTEASKNGFQESFRKLYKHRKKNVTAQGNYFEGNIV
jgi:hypothetical protein